MGLPLCPMMPDHFTMTSMKKIIHVLLFGQMLLAVGCASTKDNQDLIQKDQKKISEVLSSEVSLRADRSQLNDLRSEIPEDQRAKNDELAHITALMAEPTTDPSRLRQQYQTFTQKKRKTFQDKVKKLRAEFTKEERSLRSQFTEKAQAKRKEIDPKSMERKEVQQRYSDMDKERREFFAEERERRNSFESELRTQSKDFDSYMREKNLEFNEQMKDYTKRFNLKKAEEAAAKRAKAKESSSEFDSMKDVPSTPLEP